MSIDVITEFIAKDTVKVWTWIYNESGVLADPTLIKTTIKNPAGTSVVDDQAMTKSATGKYYYYYRTTTATTKGNYTGEINITDGSGDSAIISTATFGFKIR